MHPLAGAPGDAYMQARRGPPAATRGGRAVWESTMILIELLFGLMLAAVVLVMLPFLLLMAGIAGAVLLWCLAPAALVALLIFWLVFPGIHGLALLLLVLVIGLMLVDRRARYRAP
jgi:hypothetical protein